MVTLYFAIYPSAAAEPTWNGSWSGTPIVSGSEAARETTGVQTWATLATGLDPDTPYKIAFVADDGIDTSVVAWSDLWTTLAAAANTTGAPSTAQPTATAGASSQTHLTAGANSATQATATAGASTQEHLSAGADSAVQATSTAGTSASAHATAGADSALRGTATAGTSSHSHETLGAASDARATSTAGASDSEHQTAGAASTAQPTATAGTSSTSHLTAGANSTQQATATAGTSEVVVLPTLARAIETISPGPWMPSVAEAALHTMVNSATPSDTDWMYAETPGSTRHRLEPALLPVLKTRGLEYRIAGTAGGVTMRVYQGDTLVSTRIHASLPASFTQFTLTLSEAEAGLVTDGTNLFYEVEATA